MLMSHQVSIFCGLMLRTASQVLDVRDAGIWVCDPELQSIDEIEPLSGTDLYRVRSVPGVRWAVRLSKGLGRVRTANGLYRSAIVMGLDDDSFVGAPPRDAPRLLAGPAPARRGDPRRRWIQLPLPRPAGRWRGGTRQKAMSASSARRLPGRSSRGFPTPSGSRDAHDADRPQPRRSPRPVARRIGRRMAASITSREPTTVTRSEARVTAV